jgi:hypothetical protein
VPHPRSLRRQEQGKARLLKKPAVLKVSLFERARCRRRVWVHFFFGGGDPDPSVPDSVSAIAPSPSLMMGILPVEGSEGDLLGTCARWDTVCTVVLGTGTVPNKFSIFPVEGSEGDLLGTGTRSLETG